MARDNSRSLLCWLAAATVSTGAFATSALACRVYVTPKFEDVKYADVVVIGRISNYRIIRDKEFRRRMLASPSLSAGLRKIYEDPNKSLMTDYARFNINVEKVLIGRVSGMLTVTWDNSTFPEPARMEPGSYVIALRRPSSNSPPLRGPSATIMPSPDPKALTLLQAPCSSAFVYELGSEQARIIREILSSGKPN